MFEFKNDRLSHPLSREEYNQMTDEDILKMATVYSEGNDGLKSLLIYCAKNKIPTFASCGGHPDDPKNDTPYIGFSLNNKESIAILSKVFEKELHSYMRFFFHKFDEELRLSIQIYNKDASASFKRLQNDIENAKNVPENNLFNKICYLTHKSPNGFKYLISCDTYRIAHSNASLFTVYIGRTIEYNYPIDDKKDPYTIVNTLVDSLIQKADCGQDLHGYLKLYNMKEFCKAVPHMGMNLLNTVMQKVKSLTNTKDNERNDKEWTQ